MASSSASASAQCTARIAVLEKFTLVDEQARIEGPNVALQVDIEPDWGYADAKAFESKFAAELKDLATLVCWCCM